MRIDQGFPVFYGKDGNLLKAGKVYIGTVNEDAETHLVDTFWDDAYTLPAPNPLSIQNGIIVKQGRPVAFFTEAEFSVTIRDNNGVLQFSSLNGTPLPAQDLLTSLAPVLDTLYVKKAGDVMTGPLEIPNAVGPDDLYSRAQLDALFALRTSATFVIDSTAKWNLLITNAPGNDYSDVLVKRGSWEVSYGVLPDTCRRLRGEFGSELHFPASVGANFCIGASDFNTVEITGLLLAIDISDVANTNNSQKTGIVARDAYINNVHVVFVVDAKLISAISLIGAQCSNANNLIVNAYTVGNDSVIDGAIYGAKTLKSSFGTTVKMNNVIVSDASPVFKDMDRVGIMLMADDTTLTIECVQHMVNATYEFNELEVTWITPEVTRFGFVCSGRVLFRFVNFAGNARIELKGAFVITFDLSDIELFSYYNSTDASVTIRYACAINYSSESTYKQCTNPVYPLVSDTGSGLITVMGSLYLSGGAVQDVVFGAYRVEVNIRAGASGANYVMRTCRHVRNCAITLTSGNKYAADVYASSNTSAAAAATSAGGWNT